MLRMYFSHLHRFCQIVTLSDRTIPLSKRVGEFSFFYILSGSLNFFYSFADVDTSAWC